MPLHTTTGSQSEKNLHCFLTSLQQLSSSPVKEEALLMTMENLVNSYDYTRLFSHTAIDDIQDDILVYGDVSSHYAVIKQLMPVELIWFSNHSKKLESKSIVISIATWPEFQKIITDLPKETTMLAAPKTLNNIGYNIFHDIPITTFNRSLKSIIPTLMNYQEFLEMTLPKFKSPQMMQEIINQAPKPRENMPLLSKFLQTNYHAELADFETFINYLRIIAAGTSNTTLI